ncbi:uncharacterized protein C8Q71DRAFT_720937 [Rhodofomes roseus]|uniref:Uncharacterized protein n=1 Tax=Rhodofomes roseus TaxID=34475 RepID=A0ABQ8KSZ1_9APHY|nr:uncharacterized protein C8Q71DRAFT_720937 [Rhodofomes roseus]KAH9841867.1 hypothetical protein C8Q71DRAFT_720937 [Rhodofomes roseus]
MTQAPASTPPLGRDGRTLTSNESPTTVRAMTSSSQSPRLSPGLSYASAVAGSPTQAKANGNHTVPTGPASPSPPAPVATETNVRGRDVRPATESVDQQTGWTVVSHKKGKAKATAGRLGTNTQRPSVIHRTVLEDQPMETDESGSASRKRRRVEEDLGNEDSPSIQTRKQNVRAQTSTPAASPLPASNSGPSEPSLRTNNHAHTNEPSTSQSRDSNADSTSDLNFTVIPDSDVVEALLAPPSNESPQTPRRDSTSGRRHSGLRMRASIDTSDDDDDLSYLGDILLLFPLPPSSLPSSTPRTPVSRRTQRPATPFAPPRGHHWSEVGNNSINGDGPTRLSLQTPSIPEVEMDDATRLPDTPVPTSSSHTRRRIRRLLLRRERREHRSAPAPSPSPSLSSDDPDDAQAPFDVDALDPDFIVPPSGSWRQVQGDSTVWRGRGMAAGQRESWNALDAAEAVLAVQIPLHGTEEPGVSTRIEIMLDVFRRTLLIPGTFILPAYSIAGFHGMNTEPFWYLARGIPLSKIMALVNIGWLNSSPVTLHFDFWRDTNPHLCASGKTVPT